jgi:general secretion pathway protein L
VAACDKAWLQAALQRFESAQRPVMRLVPEVAPAAAVGEPRAWVTGSPEQAWIVSAGEAGVLNLPLASFAGSEIDQPDLELLADPPVAALAEQVLARKLRVVHPAERMLAAAQSSWDLAQFDLLHTGAARRLRGAQRQWRNLLDAPQWRPMRWAVVLLLLVNLGGLNAWAWKEQRSLDAKRDEVRELLVRSFPGVKVIVDVPLQMEREVLSLQRGGGLATARDVETMLASLAPLLPPGRSIKGMEFSPGELTLKGLGLSGAEIDALQARLPALGYRAGGEGDRIVIRAGTTP